jgi:predicted transcriptional regulator of viral defense system
VEFKTLPAKAYRRKVSPVSVEVVDRVRGEFVEMRGFSPTVDQAARLFHINRDECDRILTGLVDEGYLKRTPDGRYRLPSQQ